MTQLRTLIDSAYNTAKQGFYEDALDEFRLVLNHDPVQKEALYGAGLTLLLMVALGISALLDFDRLFLQFHLLSFANEFWMLDPTKDYLIMLVPRGFWFDAVIFVVLVALAGAVSLSTVSWVYLKKSRASPG